MFRSRHFGEQRRRLSGVGALALAATFFSLVAAPADAARQITPPPNYFCGDYIPGTISIIPPRIWSSYNRPEQVAWVIGIERWNNVRREWYTYGASYTAWSSFNWYGQSLTSWGRRFVNSKLNLPVSHAGYYRVGAAIQGNQGGVKWGGYIAGASAYCYMR
jgi:hypothetical protein